MLSFTGTLKVFVAVEPCDLRRGHNGLLALVNERLKEDIRSGALFVFSNRGHRLLKILYWDGTGLWLLSNMPETHCSSSPARKSSLPMASALWSGTGSVRGRGRIEKYSLCAAAGPFEPGPSSVDVRRRDLQRREDSGVSGDQVQCSVGSLPVA